MGKFVLEVEDALMSWFLRNMVVPRIYDLENPGFIIERLSDKKKESYRRQFFCPEEILAGIETLFVKKHGEKAHEALYSAGKRFGHSYARFLHFPTTKTSSNRELEEFCRMLIQYVAVQWATRAEQIVCNVKDKEFSVRFWDYAVCRKNGIGHILGGGGIAGIWAYMMDDDRVEGIQNTCKGKGGSFCEFYIAPKKKLLKCGTQVRTAKCKEECAEDESEYVSINKIRRTIYAQHSMRELIDSGFFKYVDRKILFQDSPHFSLEITAFYVLESELLRFRDGRKLLFDVCFDFGRKIAVSDSKTSQFGIDYLSAIGFGDVLLKNEKGNTVVTANNFPWTCFSKTSDFTIFRGLASGIASALFGRKVVLSKVKSEMIGSEFSITLEED